MIPVRCAVIGIGMIGTEHAAILAACAEAERAACCDPYPALQDSIPPGFAFHTDLGATLEVAGLEAVFVCTPQHLHRPVVEQALARGLAVFCEKPIAAAADDR